MRLFHRPEHIVIPRGTYRGPYSLLRAHHASYENLASHLERLQVASARLQDLQVANLIQKHKFFRENSGTQVRFFFSAADLSSVYWQFEVSPIESVMLPEKFG